MVTEKFEELRARLAFSYAERLTVVHEALEVRGAHWPLDRQAYVPALRSWCQNEEQLPYYVKMVESEIDAAEAIHRVLLAVDAGMRWDSGNWECILRRRAMGSSVASLYIAAINVDAFARAQDHARRVVAETELFAAVEEIDATRAECVLELVSTPPAERV